MTGLGGRLRDGKAGLAGRSEIPRAIRPAVEIIARLSAERNKLREEVRRLRALVRKAPRPEDLTQLRAERDALGRELTILRTRGAARSSSGVSQRASDSRALTRPLASLVERLERAVARVESSSRLAPAPSPAGSSHTARASRPLRRPKRGGGMLAGLVKENMSLRSDASPRPDSPPATPEPQPINTRGGGLLSGLFTQNLSLRGAGIEHD